MIGAVLEPGPLALVDYRSTTCCRRMWRMSSASGEGSGHTIVLALAVLFAAYMMMGMPGMGHSGGDVQDMDHPPSESTSRGS